MFHPVKEKPQLVSTIAPSKPLFAVYYDDGQDMLFTEPVMVFNVWQKTHGTGQNEARYADVQPVTFTDDCLQEISDADNYLGLSETEEPDRDDWQIQINIRQHQRELRLPKAGQRGK